MKLLSNTLLGLATCILLLAAIGCKSYESDWIEATVENKTGQRIQELEVAYPSASFGTNSLNAGASMHYRFQIRNSGPVKVEYTAADGKVARTQGLTLVEHQHGQLIIRLQPEGKVEFLQQLKPAS